MGRAPDRHWHIFLVSAEGGNPQQLSSGDRDESDPTWSPDGNSLAYSEYRSPLSRGAPIHILSLQTHQLSNVPGSEGIWAPRWSPDGRYIAASSPDGDKLMLFDSSTQKWEALLQLNANYMTWSSNSEALYFDTALERDSAFYCLHMSSRKLERLVRLKDVRRVMWPLGPWSGLAPDNSPLVLRDVGREDIYALDGEAP